VLDPTAPAALLLAGQHSFDLFSHLKPVFWQSTALDLVAVRYPPYSPGKMRALEFLITHVPSLPRIGWRDVLIIGLAAAVAVLGAKVGKAF
jgi:hypothetical protein